MIMDQRDEKIQNLSAQLHAAHVRILKLESSNAALARHSARLAENLAMTADTANGKVSKSRKGR